MTLNHLTSFFLALIGAILSAFVAFFIFVYLFILLFPSTDSIGHGIYANWADGI